MRSRLTPALFVLGGATIVGACCGSTPAHIRAISQALHQQTPLALADVEHIAAAARQRYDNVAPKRVRSRRTA